jgi:hypothetical protein
MKDVTKFGHVEREEHAQESVVGKWYWIDIEDWDTKKDVPHLGCITHEGSNYVEIKGIGKHGKWSYRVHNDNFFEELKPEPNPQKHIDDMVRHWQGVSSALIAEVGDIMRALGIDTKALPGVSDTNALTVPLGRREVKQYKNALVKAKDKSLPKLFEKIKDANKMVARWMAAPIMGMEGQLDEAEETVKRIKSRIWSIELYAGVTEEIVQIASGDAAPLTEKVHLFQRRLCMDEECLVDYHAGGMEFKSIDKFEEWLLKPSNLNRILPKPRCIVSMIVRRRSKERETTNILSFFINIDLEKADNTTFLYIRNGDNVYRLQTDIDFGNSLFPDRATFDPQRPMVAKLWGSRRVEELITRDEYEELVAKEADRRRKEAQWEIDNPEETWNEKTQGYRPFANPHRDSFSFNAREYHFFDPSDVYYDDIGEVVAEKIAHYNRIALIVQGLFDRSHVFMPHRMPKVWQPDDFLKAVELVYDNSAVLYDGDAPDFEDYQSQINASLAAGCITIGQDEFWMREEARKYNDRAARSYVRNFHPVNRHRPYGNPGPGYAAPVAGWDKRKRIATFEWERRRVTQQRYFSSGSQILKSRVRVPERALFNVEAYTPGEYKRFYADPRTRARYLKWAPFLLGAEDWHAGRREWKR